VLGIQLRQADLFKQLAAGDQVGEAAAIAIRLAGHGREIDQLVRDHFTDVFVPGQHVSDVFLVRQLAGGAHAVQKNDLLELLVQRRIFDQAHERREARARAQQVDVLAGLQVIDQQRAGGLAADQHFVPRQQVLQA
jgi:hypothetical protein